MEIGGNLFRAVGDGIGGLLFGTFRAVGAAALGAVHALESALPGPWLPIVIVAALVLIGWALVRR